MPKLVAIAFLLSLSASLNAQAKFFYPFPDCAPDWHITHCYVGVERGIGFIDDVDTVFSKTSTNGVFNQSSFTPAKAGKVMLSAKVVIKGKRDTLKVKDALKVIPKPEVELRIISADVKGSGKISYAFFDKNTGKKYAKKVIRNCFTEVEVKNPNTKFTRNYMGSGFEYIVSEENRISGKTLIIRCHPLDVRAAYWLGAVTVEYTIP